jgi:EAL domain-containing protein (putative c-di-GMP-specific phosphodiesterase class I)
MRQFLHHDLIGIILGILDETKLNPALLDLEITESIAASDMNRTIQIQNSIRSLGISISIDDFGTGYSSLSYLKKFPIQNLKVDRSFVSDVATNQDDASIVQAIIALGHTLGLKVVAEGVETREQLEFLQDLDCNEYQGYYFHAPMAAEDFSRLLAEHGGMEYNRAQESESE